MSVQLPNSMYPTAFVRGMEIMLPHESPVTSKWNDERNFSNDAHDPGGKTFNGIIQREYDQYRLGQELPTRDVRNLTIDEGWDIYYHSYWLPYCIKLPSGLDVSFFDMGVNAGPHAAVKILQHALPNYTGMYDGLWGSKTQKALDDGVIGAETLSYVINKYAEWRENYYRSLSGFQYFSHSWLSRTSDTLQKALTFAKGATFPAHTSETPQPEKPPMDQNQPVPTASKPDILGDIENALTAANTVLPQIIGFLGTFIPQLKALSPFLNLLPVAINAIKAIHDAQGTGLVTSASAVISHLTPGQPNAAPLAGQPQGTQA